MYVTRLWTTKLLADDAFPKRITASNSGKITKLAKATKWLDA